MFKRAGRRPDRQPAHRSHRGIDRLDWQPGSAWLKRRPGQETSADPGLTLERVLVVTGAAGVGKTSLVGRALEELGKEATRVLYVHFDWLTPFPDEIPHRLRSATMWSGPGIRLDMEERAMEKNIIGDWGAELTDAEYGRALAALGALEATGTEQHRASDDPYELAAALREEFEDGERTVVWRGAFNTKGTTPASWRHTVHKNAWALAKAWEILPKGHYWLRLAIEADWRHRPDLFDFEALLRWLEWSALDALVLVPDAPESKPPRVLWHWPLRIGVPASPEGKTLFAAIRGLSADRHGELALPMLVGEGRDKCDLLVLPAGVAAELADQPRLRLQASFIVSLDKPVEWFEALETPHADLRARTGAAGIALVGHRDHFLFDHWYRRLVRNLSHDSPVHAALWGVSDWATGIPTIIGLLPALDRLRILAIAERIDRKLELTLQPWEWSEFGYPDSSLASRVRNPPRYAQGDEGMALAREIDKREAELDERRQLRWIQASAWRGDLAVPARALAPERPSLLSIHVGPSAERRTDAPFPDQQFDFAAGPVGVSVQVELAGAAVASLGRHQRLTTFIAEEVPLHDLFQWLFRVLAAPEPFENGTPLVSLASENILLPEAGDSEMAYFAVWPQSGIVEVTGRIAIIHQNRIIQTARLTAPVGVESAEGPGLTVDVEHPVHPRLDDLDERREFDAALIAADDIGGQLRLTISHNGSVQEVQLNNLQEAIAKIRSAVFEVAHRPGDTLALNDDTLRLVLRSLAGQGRLLYDELRARLGDALNDFDRIQLVSRGTAFFPLEYVYSGPRLRLNAKVCPNAVDALEHGDCGDCKNQESREWLCPLHFWGFRKVIERHAASGDNLGKDQTGTADRRRLPSPTRTPFGAFHPVLFAASQKAFDFEDGTAWRTRLMEALSRLGGGLPPGEAQTWDGWRDLVEDTEPNPKVLVLLPHSDTALIDIDVLEIGAQEQLAKDEIDVDLIGKDAIPQLLLLLGCSTAAVTEAFAPYPELFQRAGADIIIAPLAPILGVDAAPIAERLAELLADRVAHGRKVAFGELLRDTRRKLLAEGHPGVLGIVGFGDADWLFGG